MPRVVSVRLRHPGQFYDFDGGDLELYPGDWVIVNTVRGQDMGQVVFPSREVAPEDIPGDLKSVVRLANESDFRQMERFRAKEAEVLARVQKKVTAAEIPMRLVAAEYTYNGRSLTIYFSAEQRVDFRDLVKQLAREFRARIELRQIGARDEARLLGGIGTCGRELCCATWLQDFLRISVRMAKDQELPLSPMKISGVCGRLLCCLSYECEQYRAIRSYLPTVGEEVVTLRGKGRVVAVNVPKEAVTVEIRAGLTVEVPVQELAEAGRLEAEGRLLPLPPTMLAAEEEAEVLAAGCGRPEPGAAPSPGSDKAQRRRRRRKKAPGGAPVAARQPPTPGPTDRATAPPHARASAPGRRALRRPRSGDQPRKEGRPSTPQKRPSGEERAKQEPPAARRRRPRRRRPQEPQP